MSLRTTMARSGRMAVITADGVLDTLTASAFRETIEAACCQDVDKLVLDMTHLTYLSSAGLRMLVYARQKMRDGVPIIIVGANESIERTIRLVGFHYSVQLRATMPSPT